MNRTTAAPSRSPPFRVGVGARHRHRLRRHVRRPRRRRDGEIDDVTPDRGTIIDPAGITLRADARVTVPATRGGETFDANEIDTPYRATFVPSPAYGYATGFSGGFSGPFPCLGDRPVFVERGTDDDRVGT